MKKIIGCALYVLAIIGLLLLLYVLPPKIFTNDNSIDYGYDLR